MTSSRPTRPLDIISDGYVRVPDHAAARIANKINDVARQMRTANEEVVRFSKKLDLEMSKGQRPNAASWLSGPADKVAEAYAELKVLLDLAPFVLTDEEIEEAYGPADVFFTGPATVITV